MDLRYLEIDEEALMAYVESQKVLELTPEMIVWQPEPVVEAAEPEQSWYDRWLCWNS